VANGCPNRSKTGPLQTWVSTSNINKQHNKSILVGFRGKRSSDDRLLVRAHVCYLCQNRPKTEAQHPTRPQGRLFQPNFYQQPSYMISIQFASEREHAQTFPQATPPGKMAVTNLSRNTSLWDAPLRSPSSFRTSSTHQNFHLNILTLKFQPFHGQNFFQHQHLPPHSIPPHCWTLPPALRPTLSACPCLNPYE